VPTIGLCNVPWSVKARVARSLGADPATVTFDYVGLNHLSWVRRVFVDGVERTDETLHGLRQRTAQHTSTEGEHGWTPESIDLLGAIPNYYLLYYYETEAMLRRQNSAATRASEVMAIEERLMAMYADPHLDTKPPELAKRGGAYYSEAAAALMADLVSGAGTEHVVNAPNRGAIPGLPDDVVVEVSARVGTDGITTLPVPALRPDIDALVRTMKDVELLTVEAAVNGDHGAAMRALAAHPLGPPMSQAPAVWQRLREVNAGWLGRLEP
jgi:6-phospho-beta-glucosidase